MSDPAATQADDQRIITEFARYTEENLKLLAKRRKLGVSALANLIAAHR